MSEVTELHDKFLRERLGFRCQEGRPENERLGVLSGGNAIGSLFSAWNPETKEQVVLKVWFASLDELDEVFKEIFILRQMSNQCSSSFPKLITTQIIPVSKETTGETLEMLNEDDDDNDDNDNGPSIHRVIMTMSRSEGDMDKILDEIHTWQKDEVLQLILDIVQALDYLHLRGITHNDIKPKNILMDGKRAKLTDLGLSMLDNPVFRRGVHHLVTVPYRPPEFWPFVYSSYSVGKTLYPKELFLKTDQKDKKIRNHQNLFHPFKSDAWSCGILFAEMAASIIMQKKMTLWEQTKIFRYIKEDHEPGQNEDEANPQRVMKFLLACKGWDDDQKVDARQRFVNFLFSERIHGEYPHEIQDGWLLLSRLFRLPFTRRPGDHRCSILLHIAARLLRLDPGERWDMKQVISYVQMHMTHKTLSRITLSPRGKRKRKHPPAEHSDSSTNDSSTNETRTYRVNKLGKSSHWKIVDQTIEEIKNLWKTDTRVYIETFNRNLSRIRELSHKMLLLYSKKELPKQKQAAIVIIAALLVWGGNATRSLLKKNAPIAKFAFSSSKEMLATMVNTFQDIVNSKSTMLLL